MICSGANWQPGWVGVLLAVVALAAFAAGQLSVRHPPGQSAWQLLRSGQQHRGYPDGGGFGGSGCGVAAPAQDVRPERAAEAGKQHRDERTDEQNVLSAAQHQQTGQQPAGRHRHGGIFSEPLAEPPAAAAEDALQQEPQQPSPPLPLPMDVVGGLRRLLGVLRHALGCGFSLHTSSADNS